MKQADLLYLLDCILVLMNDSSLNISLDYYATLPLYRISILENLKVFSGSISLISPNSPIFPLLK